MKTIVKELGNDGIRRKVLKSYQKKNSNLGLKKIVFLLRRTDYEDLIRIKRVKNQKQKDRSVLFFFLGLCITLASLIVVFNWNFQTDSDLLILGALDNDKFEEIQEIPNTDQPPPPPPIVIQQPVIVEVADEVILDEIEVNLDVEISEEMVIEEVEYAPVEEEEVEEIFEIVEKAPAPIGGFRAFYSQIAKNLKYPDQARRLGISGRVFVKFVVDKDGSLTDVIAIKGIGGGCDEEAVRVVRNALKWEPGKQRGRAVKVWMTLPITFQLL